MKNILQISITTLVLGSLVVLFGFIRRTQESSVLRKPIIDIDYETENRFVNETGIESLIVKKENIGKVELSKVDISKLEYRLKGNPLIKDAQVHKTISGELVVDIKQRRPIVRVISKNESFYIDEDGYLMPLSENYTARVLVVSGNIEESFGTGYRINYKNPPDSIRTSTLLDDIYRLANYVDEFDFWRSQIEQAYVNKVYDFELIPKVGNHKIVLGAVDNLKSKFGKLMIFYKKGLNKTGWNEYSTINLNYKNQVVCTKRYN